MPFGLAIAGASRIVGGAIVSWLVIATVLAISAAGAACLVGGRPITRIGAGTLYAVNPLVFDRIFAGHVGYLLGYALLPLLLASLLRWRNDFSRRGMRPALWMALVIGLTPHFFWIGGVVLLFSAAAGPDRRRALGWTGAVVSLTLVMSAYFIAPSVGHSTQAVGEADVSSYRTRADPALGLAVNVAGLYGFWRPEPRLPKQDVAGWPLFLGAIGLLAAYGLSRARRDEATRHLASAVALSGVTGFFLALGDQGPTGPLFRFLFDHVPGFAIMREPHKFVALLALAYAAGFGFALEDLGRRMEGRRARIALGVLALGLPILYTPTLFFGLAGRVKTSEYPPSWAAADRIMGEGDGKVLFLPWHQYLGFPFTGRVIANPADVTFRRDAIEGDNVELTNLATSSTLKRSGYLEFLFAHGGELCAFGRLVAPLGVEYVALASAADSDRYGWLNEQVDLERVLDRPGMVLYRNAAYSGGATRGRQLERAADWGELASLANEGKLLSRPYLLTTQGPGDVADQPCHAPPSPRAAFTGQGRVTPQSPVSYRVPAGPTGFVGLPEPFDPSWQLKGRPAIELAGGLVGLPTDGTASTARFGHWRRVQLGYATSLLATATVLVAGLQFRRSRNNQNTAG
ncbi:MAG TPA: hypothetical protein VNA57_12840 [Acidimicrobiales bacterium]|nr:hypothetical protein [Acidimicrobiales bacterium]